MSLSEKSSREVKLTPDLFVRLKHVRVGDANLVTKYNVIGQNINNTSILYPKKYFMSSKKRKRHLNNTVNNNMCCCIFNYGYSIYLFDIQESV